MSREETPTAVSKLVNERVSELNASVRQARPV
jgi:hypothetical protein